MENFRLTFHMKLMLTININIIYKTYKTISK